MELAIVLAVCVALYMWASARGRRREEIRDLRTFVHMDRPLDTLGRTTSVDYVAMRMTIENVWYEPGHEDTTTEYAVRRNDRGRWGIRMMETSREAIRKSLQRSIDDPGYLLNKDLRREELAGLAGPAKWEPLDDELAAQIESQYQRFLIHWHDDG